MGKNDHDLNSRKFLLTVFCILILTGMTLSAAFLEVLQVVLPAFIGGVLGVLSLYFTGNVMHKYVCSKTIENKDPEEKGCC